MSGAALALLQNAIAKAGDGAGQTKTPGRAPADAAGENGQKQTFEGLLNALGQGGAPAPTASHADPAPAAHGRRAVIEEAMVKGEITPGAGAKARLDAIDCSRPAFRQPDPAASCGAGRHAVTALSPSRDDPSQSDQQDVAEKAVAGSAIPNPGSWARGGAQYGIGGHMERHDGKLTKAKVDQATDPHPGRDGEVQRGTDHSGGVGPFPPAGGADQVGGSAADPLSEGASRAFEPRSPTIAAGKPLTQDRAAAPPIAITELRQETHLAPAPPIFAQLAGVISAEALQTPSPIPASDGPGVANAASDSGGSPIANPARVLTFKLQPGDLGSVDIRLDLKGRTLGISLTIDKPATLASVTRESGHLVEALRHSGYGVDSLVIRQSTPVAGASEASTQTNNTQTNQDRQDDNRGGAGQGMREPASRKQDGRDQRHPTRNADDGPPRSGRYL